MRDKKNWSYQRVEWKCGRGKCRLSEMQSSRAFSTAVALPSGVSDDDDALWHSGRLLSLQDPGHGAVPVPRPGSEHDERRLRFLHVVAGALAFQSHHVSAVDDVRRRCSWYPSTSTSFSSRQTGPSITISHHCYHLSSQSDRKQCVKLYVCWDYYIMVLKRPVNNLISGRWIKFGNCQTAWIKNIEFSSSVVTSTIKFEYFLCKSKELCVLLFKIYVLLLYFVVC